MENLENKEVETKNTKKLNWKWLLLLLLIVGVVICIYFVTKGGVGISPNHSGYLPPVNQTFTGKVEDNYPTYDEKTADEQLEEIYLFKYKGENGIVETIYLTKAEEVVLEEGFIAAENLEKGVFSSGYSIPKSEISAAEILKIMNALSVDITEKKKEWTANLELLANQDVVRNEEAKTWMKAFAYFTGGRNVLCVSFVNESDDSYSFSEYEFYLDEATKNDEIKMLQELLTVNGFELDYKTIYSQHLNK